MLYIAFIVMFVAIVWLTWRLLIVSTALKMANNTLGLAEIAMNESALLLEEAVDAALYADQNANAYREMWLNLYEFNQITSRLN